VTDFSPIWPHEAVVDARQNLTCRYLIVVVSLMLALGCAIEVLAFAQTPQQPQAGAPAARL